LECFKQSSSRNFEERNLMGERFVNLFLGLDG
jgi:hypothetical protein